MQSLADVALGPLQRRHTFDQTTQLYLHGVGYLHDRFKVGKLFGHDDILRLTCLYNGSEVLQWKRHIRAATKRVGLAIQGHQRKSQNDCYDQEDP